MARIKQTIHLFSVLAERLDTRVLEHDVDYPITAGGLLDDLALRFTAIEELRGVIRLAVNCEYVADDRELSDGDELALITPTSGG